MKGWDSVLKHAVYTLNQRWLYDAVPSISRIWKSRGERGSFYNQYLITHPQDFLLPLSAALSSAGLEIFVSDMKHNNGSIELEYESHLAIWASYITELAGR